MKTWNGETEYKYAHWKRDGHFLQITKKESGLVFALSRQGRVLTDDLKYHPKLSVMWTRQPLGSSVAGELWLPGKRASAIKTAIVNRDINLRFEMFCAFNLPEDAPLTSVRDWAIQIGYDFVPWEPFAPDIIDYPLPKDCEGYVFKDGNLINWAKWKPVKTIDLIVSSTIPGKGKYRDYLGALVCKTYEGHEVCSVSGMTDKERAEFTESRPVGSIVEIAYQYVGTQGRLRHPRFVRIREDKLPEECGINQDLDLYEFWRGVKVV